MFNTFCSLFRYFRTIRYYKERTPKNIMVAHKMNLYLARKNYFLLKLATLFWFFLFEECTWFISRAALHG